MKIRKVIASATIIASVITGGVGNFYHSTSCTAKNGKLKAWLTNYDIHAFSDQRYHHGANDPVGWHLDRIVYDGNKWPYSLTNVDRMAWSGNKYDGYQDFGNIFADHTVIAYWHKDDHSESSGCVMREI